MKPHTNLVAAGLASLLIFSAAPQAGLAADAEIAYSDIQETYGSVPGFFRLFPANSVAEAWEAFKALQMNPQIGLDAKARELIGIAVATQGKCRPCAYFHAAAASANGASENEISAAAALVAATRRLHTTLEQAEADSSMFARETDLVLWGDIQTAERRRPAIDISCSSPGAAATCE